MDVTKLFVARKISEISVELSNIMVYPKWTHGTKMNATKYTALMEPFFHHFTKKKKDSPFSFRKCADQYALNTWNHRKFLALKRINSHWNLMYRNLAHRIAIAVIMKYVRQKDCWIYSHVSAHQLPFQLRIFTKVINFNWISNQFNGKAFIQILILLTFRILVAADLAVLEKVDGLNPQQELHEFFMHFYQVIIFCIFLFNYFYTKKNSNRFSLLERRFRLLVEHK